MSNNGKLAPRKNQSQGLASLIAHSLVVAGRDVQVRLEPSYWEGLDEICRREDLTPDELCADVQERMEQQARRWGGQGGVSLANALRVFVVGYFRQAATERGHARAGHGQGDPFVCTPFDRPAANRDA